MGVLRFLLALSVAVAHTGGPFLLFDSRCAVQVFYIVSGFLIQMILERKYRDNVALFYSNRALRIYVPYICVLGMTCALCLLLNCGFVCSIASVAASLDVWSWCYLVASGTAIVGQDVSLFLGWSPERQLYFVSSYSDSPFAVWSLQPIPQAWTVAVELYFYAVAPFLLRGTAFQLVMLVAMSLLCRVFAAEAGLGHDPWTYRFFPFELAWFLLGALSYRLGSTRTYRRVLDASPRLISSCAACAAAVVVLAWPHSAALRSACYAFMLADQPVSLFLGACVILPCLFRFASLSRWDRFLGDLSYPMYITHFTVIWVVGWSGIVGSESKWLCLGATLAVSVVLSLAVERPLDRWRQRRAGAAAAV